MFNMAYQIKLHAQSRRPLRVSLTRNGHSAIDE